jgi:molecular chaperone DnaJ
VDVSHRAARADPYAVLGVAPDADAAEISRAYRRRLREVHPDTRDQAGGPDRAAAGVGPPSDLQALQEAYLVLRDPVRRARYDAQRRARRTDEHGVPSAADQAGAVPVPVRVRRRPPPPRSWLIRVGPVRIGPLRHR